MAPRTRKPPSSSSGKEATTLGVVSRATFYRQCLAHRLGHYPGLVVRDLGAGHTDSLGESEQSAPDLILVDLAPPAACAFAESALDRFPAVRLLAVIRTEREEEIVRLAESGFLGFVPTESTMDQVVREIQAAMRDELECSPRVAGALVRGLGKRSAEEERPRINVTGLTKREEQIVEFVIRGLSNKEIAAELNVAAGTVKNHVHHILEKLKLHNRWDLARLVVSGSGGLALVRGKEKGSGFRR